MTRMRYYRKYEKCSGRVPRWAGRCPGIGRGVVLLILAMLLAITAFSQTPQATIRGQLADSSGAPIPDALIHAVNEETNATLQASSGPAGEYAFSILKPGSYRVEVAHSGFRKYVESGIQLSVGQSLRLNIHMDPGGPAEEMIVTARRDLVEPDTTHNGSVIENHQITHFPLDGPGYCDFSASVMKDSKVREGLNLQFRVELFNAFNHTSFDLPDNFLGSSSFGRINSAQNPRLIQFGFKIIY
jgi:hypothetical protein